MGYCLDVVEKLCRLVSCRSSRLDIWTVHFQIRSGELYPETVHFHDETVHFRLKWDRWIWSNDSLSSRMANEWAWNNLLETTFYDLEIAWA